jgi:PAS domain S-box-containing protein
MPAKSISSKTMRIDIPPDMRGGPDDGERHALLRVPGVSQDAPSIGGTDFQQLFRSVYDAAVITNRDGGIVDANIRAAEFLQLGRAELCQLNVMQIISGADPAALRTVYDSLEQDRFVLIQAYCARKNGALFPAEIAVNRLPVEGQERLCFFIRDVTLRRQAEEMLRTVHNAIQNAATGIAITDRVGRLEYVNTAAIKLWGYADADAMLRQSIRTCFRDDHLADAMMQTVLSGKNWTGELAVVRSDGAVNGVQVSAAGNRDTDDELAGIVLSFLDISDKKRADQAELQAERQRVMVESLGAACHHLGQPATILLASLELMTRMTDPDRAVAQELLQSSLEAAESLRKMLHELNGMTEYRTTPYMESHQTGASGEARILAFDVPGSSGKSTPDFGEQRA